MSIEVKKIQKTFGNFVALNNISLDFPSGELVALLGPSGCGKTTLLRIIAGLETADSGNVILDGIDTSKTAVREREVGFVFQHYALFKHMTVFDNVAFGLQVKHRSERPSKAEISHKVHELLKLVQLDWLHDRFPAQLSGGQRQRVALARALVNRPAVLLLDEPLGALDLKLREQMQLELKELQREVGITFIFVTHDQEEALTMSDRIAVFNNGRIEQLGTPREIYDNPKSAFVSEFVGQTNKLNFDGRRINVRPEHITLSKSGSSNGHSISGTVTDLIFVGAITRYRFKALDGTTLISTNTDGDIGVGDNVTASWSSDKEFPL